MALKIAILVHGRFHAFDLARELLRRGHDVTLFTNYPHFAVRRFGVPPERVRSYRAHGLGSRLLGRLFPGGLGGRVEQLTNSVFGRWAARQVARSSWDVVVAFSGIAEPAFAALGGRALRVLQRGSSHIRVQRRLLDEEEARTGRPIDKPSDWIIAREEREYRLADTIHVLSGFAYQSFVEQGVDPGKLYRLGLGVDTRQFRASEAVMAERCRRLRAGGPLRVLNVGTFSCRKGAADFEEVIRRLGRGRFAFRFVGPVAWDARPYQHRLTGVAKFVGRRPQHQLPTEYAWGDVFVLPTVEDGFAMVLPQSLAAGVPVIVTPNCAGPDLLREGETGWIVPARQPSTIIDRLRWCDQHRDELARIACQAHATWQPPDWAETARQAEEAFREALVRREVNHKTGASALSLGAL
jgi:glycosyltransferase involved in cell wall biosynthesis